MSVTVIVVVIGIWLLIVSFAVIASEEREIKALQKALEAETSRTGELYHSINGVVAFAESAMRKSVKEFDEVLTALPKSSRGYNPQFRIARHPEALLLGSSSENVFASLAELVFNARLFRAGNVEVECWERNGWLFFRG